MQENTLFCPMKFWGRKMCKVFRLLITLHQLPTVSALECKRSNTMSIELGSVQKKELWHILSNSPTIYMCALRKCIKKSISTSWTFFTPGFLINTFNLTGKQSASTSRAIHNYSLQSTFCEMAVSKR
jgi:hypothetical protein